MTKAWNSLLIYTSLIPFWRAGGQPDGTSGTPIDPGMSLADKTSAVNSWVVNDSSHVDVAISEVQGYLSLQGVLTAMEDWLAANSTPSLTRTAVKELFRTISSTRLDSIRMSEAGTFAAVAAMIGAAEAAGLFTADQAAALLAMASPPVKPWWSTISNSPLTEEILQEVMP